MFPIHHWTSSKSSGDRKTVGTRKKSASWREVREKKKECDEYVLNHRNACWDKATEFQLTEIDWSTKIREKDPIPSLLLIDCQHLSFTFAHTFLIYLLSLLCFFMENKVNTKIVFLLKQKHLSFDICHRAVNSQRQIGKLIFPCK